jgi:hypothetical protein
MGKGAVNVKMNAPRSQRSKKRRLASATRHAGPCSQAGRGVQLIGDKA